MSVSGESVGTCIPIDETTYSQEALLKAIGGPVPVKIPGFAAAAQIPTITPEELKTSAGSTLMNLHSLFKELSTTKPRVSKATKAAHQLPIRQLIDNLENAQNLLDQNPTWFKKTDTDSELSEKLVRLYGVTNLKRWKDNPYAPLFQGLFGKYIEVFNFLWIGYSVGGLHYDDLNNVLVQLHGTKRVLIFAPDVTDVVDGRHYPQRVPVVGFLSKETLEKSPWIAKVPYYDVTLKPGDAVTIPAYAYHAPVGGYDSISLNSFIIASPKHHPGLCASTEGYAVPKMSPSFKVLKRIRKLFDLTGIALIDIGPYEFI